MSAPCPPLGRSLPLFPERILILASLAVALCVLAGPAHADMSDGFTLVGKYESEMVQRVSAMVSDPDSKLRVAASRLLYAMALGLFVWKAAGWAIRGFDLDDVVLTISLIVMAAGLIAIYPVALPALFGASIYIGNALLGGLAGVPPDSVTQAELPIELTRLFQSYTFEPECGIGWAAVPGGCLVGNFAAVWASIATGVVVILLGIASLLVDVWSFWGFSVAMAIGLVFIPFMLYERLNFLFDGWVRFLFGFLIYTIVARVNLALVAVAMMSYQLSTVTALLGGHVHAAAIPKVSSFADVIGMLLFAGVGTFTLAATGAFARSMVMGAGGGGVQFSAVARSAAQFVGGTAAGLVTAGQGAAAAGSQAKAAGRGAGAVARATLAGAAGATVDAAKRGNRAFSNGYTIGREAAAGAMHSSDRFRKLGAEPNTPTGGGVAPNAIQRAQGILGAVIGATAAAVHTGAALTFGLSVKDSFAEKRALAKATETANELGYRASSALDAPNSRIGEGGRVEIAHAVQRLNETMRTAKTSAEVNQAANDLREALWAAGSSSDTPPPSGTAPWHPPESPGGSSPGGAGANSGAESTAASSAADQKADDLAAAYREIEAEERKVYGGLTYDEWIERSRSFRP